MRKRQAVWDARDAIEPCALPKRRAAGRAAGAGRAPGGRAAWPGGARAARQGRPARAAPGRAAGVGGALGGGVVAGQVRHPRAAPQQLCVEVDGERGDRTLVCPIGKSVKRRLNLSGSWQQGHSTAYNTAFRPSRLQGIYPNERVELPCTGRRAGHRRVCSWARTSRAYL